MAGETPGANAISAKRKLRWADDKSTNKIYASGDISALGDHGTSSDTVRRPPHVPALSTPSVRADDKSADKYYANGGSNRVRAGQTQPKPAAASPKAPRSKSRPVSNTMLVSSKEDVNGVLAAAVEQLNEGREYVVIYVKNGDSQLLKRTRAALELLVTREAITEEQYRSVRLSYDLSLTPTPVVPVAPKPAPAVPTVVVENTEPVAETPSFLDPSVEPQVSEQLSTESVDEDDADNDFVNKPEDATTPDVQASTPPDNQSRRRGRRSGRGVD